MVIVSFTVVVELESSCETYRNQVLGNEQIFLAACYKHTSVSVCLDDVLVSTLCSETASATSASTPVATTTVGQ